MQDIFINQICCLHFTLLVQWELWDAKSDALGVATVPDHWLYYVHSFFFQSGLQQLYLFINTKATDPLALLFKKLWSKASPRVSQQARLTRSGSGTLLSLHRGTTEAQNAAWCLLGNHPPLSMACAINEYKDLRSPSSTSQRPPWPRAVGLLRVAQEGELRQGAQELLEVWVWCPADWHHPLSLPAAVPAQLPNLIKMEA